MTALLHLVLLILATATAIIRADTRTKTKAKRGSLSEDREQISSPEGCQQDLTRLCFNRTKKMQCLVDNYVHGIHQLSPPCLNAIRISKTFSCIDEILTYCSNENGRWKTFECLEEHMAHILHLTKAGQRRVECFLRAL